MAPSSKNISSRGVVRIIEDRRGRRRIPRHGNALSGVAPIKVALDGERIAGWRLPICAKTSLAHLPLVKRLCIGMKLGGARESHSVNPKRKAVAVSSAIAKCTGALVHITAASGDKKSARLRGVFRDDVDHAVKGIRSPDGAAGSANHFDAVYVLQHHVFDIPVNAGEKRAVDASPVNQHKHRFGKLTAKSANAHRPMIGIDASYFHTGNKTQSFRDACGARTTDVFLAKHINRRGNLLHAFGFLGDGGYLNIAQ